MKPFMAMAKAVLGKAGFYGPTTREELIDATDYPSFDVEGVNKTFLEWEHDKMHDIMAYRNKSYRSLMTGTMSPAHHTPWKDELDDSMEAYLKGR